MRRWWVLALAGLLTSCTGYLWGDNAVGQLGDGTGSGTAIVPTAEASASDWNVLSAGNLHTCGVKKDQSLWCWGANQSGQIGNGTFGSGTFVSSPVQIGTSNTWSNVSAGNRHSCAIDTSKRLWCWGLNSSGQIGDGTTTRRTTPTQIGTATDWKAVTLGGRHTCAIRYPDDLYCWGSNSSGQLGIGDTTNRIAPVSVAGSWKQVDAGVFHTCAITTGDQALKCWGRNSYGEAGKSDFVFPQLLNPTQVDMSDSNGPIDPADIRWTSVSAGDLHTCALYTYLGPGTTVANRACVGNNDSFQLGLGSIDRSSFTINNEPFGLGWTRISAGGEHTCGIQAGTLKCWGGNTYGQLGDGTTSSRTSPTPVALPGTWIDVSAGGQHTVATENTN